MPASFQASGRSMRRRTQNQTSGTKKTTPIRRPSKRWKYSHQKIPLNSPRLMAWFTRRYSGVSLYFSNVACQAASLSGGSVPTIGCHSTIESPEWVRRVTPPTTTIAKTRAQQTSSHAATARRLVGAGGADAACPCSESEDSLAMSSAMMRCKISSILT